MPAPHELTIVAREIEFAAASGEANQPRRFSMVAYTGGPMQLAGWKFPVVVDLAGLDVGRSRRPILLDHTRDVEHVMGQTDQVTVANHQLLVAGQVLGDSAKARQVVALADRGFGWQASIGAKAHEVEFVPEGRSTMVNGREVVGPVNIARRATLGEVSFVVLGADENTQAVIATQTSEQRGGTRNMELADWVAAQGFSIDALDERQRGSLEALHQRVHEPPAAPVTTNDDLNALDKLRAEIAAETARTIKIRRACAGRHDELEAKAIAEGWEPSRVELEVLRATRPAAPAIQATDLAKHGRALEAAICLSAGIAESELAKRYDAETLDAAQGRDLRGAGIHSLIYEVIQAAGGHVRLGRVDNETIRAALVADRQLTASAGFSTISLSGILSNVANKAMLAAYEAVASVVARFCAETDVNDFKQVTRYRLTGAGVFEKVGPDGELKHATLSEGSYTNRIDTYGRMLSLTRQMMINDDLGAFLQLPRIIGRMSALKREEAVFELLLSNPAGFFSGGNKNFISGADTVLSIAALTQLEQKFLDQTDSEGKPILVNPAILLVPTSLKVTSEQLMTETRVNETTAAGKPSPANNPHAGKFTPVATPYLNSQAIAGGSAVAWYLFANPADLAAFEIAYLRGRRVPTIESGETDFNTLGMQWRGYFDFGVGVQDFRAAAKSKGEV
jgi:hypothetical protein